MGSTIWASTATPYRGQLSHQGLCYSRPLRVEPGSAPPPALLLSTLRTTKIQDLGGDAIPNSAYKHGGALAKEANCLARQHCSDSAHPPTEDFNSGTWVFLVKKLLPTDLPAASALSRATLEARPLAVKCCDNKAVGSTTIDPLKVFSTSTASILQRGLAPGRQFILEPCHEMYVRQRHL